MTIPIALSIAGSDPSGGAGIQADLKTFSALGVYGATAITALTAQNTQGIAAIEMVSPQFVAAQIDAVCGDLTVGAVKIGMLGTAPVVAGSDEPLPAASGARRVFLLLRDRTASVPLTWRLRRARRPAGLAAELT